MGASTRWFVVVMEVVRREWSWWQQRVGRGSVRPMAEEGLGERVDVVGGYGGLWKRDGMQLYGCLVTEFFSFMLPTHIMHVRA